MALPVMTEEQRAKALEMAQQVRKERAELLAKVHDGTMTFREFVERGDRVTGKTKLKSLLVRLSGIGPKSADKHHQRPPHSRERASRRAHGQAARASAGIHREPLGVVGPWLSTSR